MTYLCNLALNLYRLAGVANVTEATRSTAPGPDRALALIGLTS